jgi:hypothetical protein
MLQVWDKCVHVAGEWIPLEHYLRETGKGSYWHAVIKIPGWIWTAYVHNKSDTF